MSKLNKLSKNAHWSQLSTVFKSPLSVEKPRSGQRSDVDKQFHKVGAATPTRIRNDKRRDKVARGMSNGMTRIHGSNLVKFVHVNEVLKHS